MNDTAEKLAAATDRQTEILGAVDRLAIEWDKWSNDITVGSAIEEQSPLDDALAVVIEICEAGDVPSTCRELIDTVGRLAVEYDDYRNGGKWNNQTREPLPSFNAAFHAVAKARVGAGGNAKRRFIESVKTCDEQKLSDLQIATIYGARNEQLIWVGPFFDSRGNLDRGKVQQERLTPGSVITADWIHPQDVIDQKTREKDVTKRLNRLQRKAEEDKPPTFTEADVVRYMQEGTNANQVAFVFKISLDEVRRIAEKNHVAVFGIELTASQAPTDSEPQRLVNEESQSSAAVKATIVSRILEMAGKSSPPEIKAAIKTEFHADVSIQEITATIREDRKRKDAAADPKGQKKEDNAGGVATAPATANAV